jgi:hypothetical protein
VDARGMEDTRNIIHRVRYFKHFTSSKTIILNLAMNK